MPSGAVPDHPNPFPFWQLSKGLKTAILSTLSLLFPRRTSWILSPALCIVRCWSSSLPCKGFSGQASVCRDKASHTFQCRNWVVNSFCFYLSKKPEKGINRQNHQRIYFPKTHGQSRIHLGCTGHLMFSYKLYSMWLYKMGGISCLHYNLSHTPALSNPLSLCSHENQTLDSAIFLGFFTLFFGDKILK